jgi:glycosyltransferase involved in cell wall biosynthesis
MTKAEHKIKVAVVIDEYFGGAGTAFGGYGFLARNVVGRHIPCDSISLEVLLNKKKKLWHFWPTYHSIDGVNVIDPPSKRWLPLWLFFKGYDVYLTIELTHDVLQYDRRPWKRIVHWIQDPRPWYVWRKISSMKRLPEHCFYNSAFSYWVNLDYTRGHIRFISQGSSLNDFARDLYALPADLPIHLIPNPVPIRMDFDPDEVHKEDLIVFLGRIESQKRAWLFCEIARRMPHYQFAMIGKFHRSADENLASIQEYMDGSVKNLSFVGHLENNEKFDYLKRAKILLNTSIWEGIPVSFLEALSVGTLIVSDVNPDQLPERFGAYVGEVPGDGFDKADAFADAIECLMNDEDRRRQLAREAVSYIRQNHRIETFVENMRNLLYEEGALSRSRKKAYRSRLGRRFLPSLLRRKPPQAETSAEQRNPSFS